MGLSLHICYCLLVIAAILALRVIGTAAVAQDLASTMIGERIASDGGRPRERGTP